MPQASRVSTNPLIGSDRVEGTAVYARDGARIGSVKRLVIEKLSGRVVYAVVSFDAFSKLGDDTFKLPWAKLGYDTSLGGYRTDVGEPDLDSAPSFARGDHDDWLDPGQEDELHAYFRIRPDGRAF